MKQAHATTARKHPHARGEDARALHAFTSVLETPPRSWGRPWSPPTGSGATRNTPTLVGKTALGREFPPSTWKHPHARGEDGSLPLSKDLAEETPPRSWGRHARSNSPASFFGNTPTLVGKTIALFDAGVQCGKHPHARGEDSPRDSINLSPRETPPRSWGRPCRSMRGRMWWRNTPTLVGKTKPCPDYCGDHEKHPHARGEDEREPAGDGGGEETPPRSWGRQCRLAVLCSPSGNTPTLVGKTPAAAFATLCHGKHPHARGEDHADQCAGECGGETPPRSWGRRCWNSNGISSAGNTPTLVGKTPCARRLKRPL